MTIWRALSPYFFTTDSWLYVGSNGLRTRKRKDNNFSMGMSARVVFLEH
jgi:hypothetical protein